MTTPIQTLTSLGQSLWYDNIQRRLLAKSPEGENGELAAMIQRGDIRGVTSNPSIFQNAIAKTHDYDSALAPLALSGWSAEEIFWQLAIEDIRAACDLFRPLYDQTGGVDGYVSLEVSPYLANQTEPTVEQAKHLWATVNRPNLMIKIPATKTGLPAIRQTIAAGINVNVTLIFSIDRYHEVMDAYLSGLEDRLLAGGTIENIHSVASFFVSRLDSKIDPKLPAASPLLGKAAIANAKLAYDAFKDVFSSPRFGKLQLAQANYQRPLWASTGTKNPAYPDTLYVDNLIGPATVNTVPPATLDAFRDHGHPAETIMQGVDECRKQLADLEALGISMTQVTDELEKEGVKAFEDAFTGLLATVNERRAAVADSIAPLLPSVKQAVASLDSAPAKLWAHDPTLWTSDLAGQAEIRNRLGWLHLPETMKPLLADIKAFAKHVHENGFTHFLLLGMGGSSLAPEVMSLVSKPSVTFAILDSTDPGQVLETAAKFPVEKTLFIVSSKSGGTAEVNAMFNYFWAQAQEKLGEKGAKHFIAITDPGTSLEALANARGFAKTFISDPTVGGRYSVLSPFGLVPAALMGIDIDKFLARAEWMMRECAADVSAARNPGLVLGAILGQSALEGRDKLTLLADDGLLSVGSWLEQLIAESTGKEGKGVVVVDAEPLAAAESYSTDRIFAYLRQNGQHDELVKALRAAGQPVLEFPIEDVYALAAEFYRWEVATAVASAVLAVNAFDQPDVQDAKDRTNAKIKEYKENGKLVEGEHLNWSAESVESRKSKIENFLASAQPGDYVAINAYIRRNDAMLDALQTLRKALLTKTGCATTLGFGPRFLHSTGQLHKGGPASGLFIQITADPETDLDIPTGGMTFGTLERAQSLGDYEALAARGRRILRIHLPEPGALKQLIEMFAA
jgi:transaldolase/glucose-6-phosphate isomerase